MTVPVNGDGGITALDAPTAVTGLSTNGIFGAVILQWMSRLTTATINLDAGRPRARKKTNTLSRKL